MNIYRITLTKWSKSLVASGREARWNSNGMRMIYTAQSRALACLENVVHRGSKGLNMHFKVMIIQIPDEVAIKTINPKKLPKNWSESIRCASCKAIGDKWLKSYETAVLKIPSAIVASEHNYLINPMHEDFSKIKLIRTEPFHFDKRIKAEYEA